MATTKSERTVAATLRRCCAVGVIGFLVLGVVSCDIYEWLYGDASIIVRNETEVDIVELNVYDANDLSVYRDEVPVPSGEEREINGLMRAEYRLFVSLDGYSSFTKSIDLTSLEQLVVMVNIP